MKKFEAMIIGIPWDSHGGELPAGWEISSVREMEFGLSLILVKNTVVDRVRVLRLDSEKGK